MCIFPEQTLGCPRCLQDVHIKYGRKTKSGYFKCFECAQIVHDDLYKVCHKCHSICLRLAILDNILSVIYSPGQQFNQISPAGRCINAKIMGLARLEASKRA